MPTAHYTIHSPGTGRTLKVSYRGGRFFRLELVHGKKPSGPELVQMAKVTPPTEAEMPNYKEKWAMLQYTKIEKEQTLYQQYVSAWFAFYQRFMEVPPKFTGADGKALNQIKAHLTHIGGSDAQGLGLFKMVLDNWHKLESFHRDNTDLKYMNSRLNVILNAIKKAGQAGTRGADNSVTI